MGFQVTCPPNISCPFFLPLFTPTAFCIHASLTIHESKSISRDNNLDLAAGSSWGLYILRSSLYPDSRQVLSTMGSISGKKIRSYIVEHLDPELGPWSTLEYRSIAQDSAKAGVRFFLSSVPTVMSLPPELRDLESLTIEHRSVEKLFQEDKGRVCLLDPAATVELSPEDGTKFDVFLFGGILGIIPMEQSR